MINSQSKMRINYKLSLNPSLIPNTQMIKQNKTMIKMINQKALRLKTVNRQMRLVAWSHSIKWAAMPLPTANGVSSLGINRMTVKQKNKRSNRSTDVISS